MQKLQRGKDWGWQRDPGEKVTGEDPGVKILVGGPGEEVAGGPWCINPRWRRW